MPVKQKTHSNYMRKTIIVITCGFIALLLGYTGYRGYQVWRQKHWLTMADRFAAQSDSRNEILCLQQTLQLNPRNFEACRLMADLAAAANSPDALIWRQRVLMLNPNSLVDRLALAQTGVTFNDYIIASNALAGVDDMGKKTAVYHNAAGTLAYRGGQVSEAIYHFTEAARLDPDNPVPQMNLAVIRLHGTNLTDMAKARTSLKQISVNSTNTAIRSQAQRELVIDAIRFGDTNIAMELAKELAAPTNAVFSDRLLQLEVLRQVKSSGYKSALEEYQHEAADDSSKLSAMATWLINTTTPSESLKWLQSLPLKTQTNQPAALLAAQCQLQLRDWHELQVALQNQNWAGIEFIRHAFLARAMREQDLIAASNAEWGLALTLAGNQKNTLILLFRAAAEWHWNSEAEQILWTVVNRYPEEKWAVSPLSEVLIAGGRTRSLMQLFGILSQRTPADLEIKNNLAITAMLLGAQELNPYGLAQEVYKKAPKYPSYASTYAFSLYQQKKYVEALNVMQQLQSTDLEKSPIAGYYGIILKATGHAELAKSYLRRITKAQLLPEEQFLFQQAMVN
jgi:Flp pilus assembly protein TadD